MDKLDCQSSFVHLAASGTPDRFTAEADCDLSRLAAELGQFVDLGSWQPAGTGQASLNWQRSADGAFQLAAIAKVADFHLAMSGRQWSEPSLAASLNAAGLIPTAGGGRIDKAAFELTAGPVGAVGSDHLSAELLEPATGVNPLAMPGSCQVAISLQGDLARWQARLAPWVPLAAWQLGGACTMSARVAYSAKGVAIQQVQAVVNKLHAWGNGWFVDEPVVQFDGAATWDAASRTLQLAPTTLASSAVAIQAKATTLRLPARGAESDRRHRLASRSGAAGSLDA